LSPEIHRPLWKAAERREIRLATAITGPLEADTANSRSNTKGYIFYQNPTDADKQRFASLPRGIRGNIHKIFHKTAAVQPHKRPRRTGAFKKA
jgi:hypothetical protein